MTTPPLSNEQFDQYIFWGLNTEGVDLGDTEQRDQLLHKLLAACFSMRELTHGHASYFEPWSGAVVIDAQGSAEQRLLSLLHETAHLTASHNIFGSTIQALSDVQDALLKALDALGVLSRILGSWDNPEEFRERLVTHRDLIRDTYRHATAGPLLGAFHQLATRRRLMLDRWQVYQEGFATYAEVHEEVSPFIRSIIPAVLGLKETEIAAVLARARSEKLSLLSTKSSFLPDVYHEGYGLFQRLFDRGERNVFVAATFACHFPYHACDLVDCPDAAFDQLVDSELLNIDLRLKRLAEYPVALPGASSSSDSHRTVLEFILRRELPEPFAPTARCYERGRQRMSEMQGRSRALLGGLRNPG